MLTPCTLYGMSKDFPKQRRQALFRGNKVLKVAHKQERCVLRRSGLPRGECGKQCCIRQNRRMHALHLRILIKEHRGPPLAEHIAYCAQDISRIGGTAACFFKIFRRKKRPQHGSACAILF